MLRKILKNFVCFELTVNVNGDAHSLTGWRFCNYGVKILLPRDKHQKWVFFELKAEACGVLTGVLNCYR